jgi:hypothetical protein
MGLTALVAYSLGRHDAPSGSQSPDLVLSTAPAIEKPVALVTAPSPAVLSPAPTPPPTTANTPPAPAPKPSAPQPDAKRKTEVALTAAAIAAIIVQASRDNLTEPGIHAPAQRIVLAMVRLAAAEAPIRDREEPRRSAIRET